MQGDRFAGSIIITGGGGGGVALNPASLTDTQGAQSNHCMLTDWRIDLHTVRAGLVDSRLSAGGSSKLAADDCCAASLATAVEPRRVELS